METIKQKRKRAKHERDTIEISKKQNRRRQEKAETGGKKAKRKDTRGNRKEELHRNIKKGR